MIKKSKTFNVSFEFIRMLFALQDYSCAVCKRKHRGPDSDRDESDWLHVDHEHHACEKSGVACGKCIRGLLCGVCNSRGLSWYEEVRNLIPPDPAFEEYLSNPPARALYNQGLS
jgi:hypothetical protein